MEWLKKRGVRSMEKRAAESMEVRTLALGDADKRRSTLGTAISEALLSLGLDKNGVIVELRALLPAHRPHFTRVMLGSLRLRRIS